MAWLALAYYAVVCFGGWTLVRGHGHGWRLLVWLLLLFGPFGVAAWFAVRRGVRIGSDAAHGRERSDTLGG